MGRSCRNDFVWWAGVESEGCSIMVLMEQFGAGWLVGGTMDLTCKESYDDQQDVSKCYILFGTNEVH